MSADFHAAYRRYALLTPLAWLQAVDGGAVRQVRAITSTPVVEHSGRRGLAPRRCKCK